jgi:hypothetical protein
VRGRAGHRRWCQHRLRQVKHVNARTLQREALIGVHRGRCILPCNSGMVVRLFLYEFMIFLPTHISFINTDIFRHILMLDISIFLKDNVDWRE